MENENNNLLISSINYNNTSINNVYDINTYNTYYNVTFFNIIISNNKINFPRSNISTYII